MELRQLEYFLAVAEESNFTRAATREHVTQPGVSAQIRRLERELGERLFDRSGREVQLTSAGQAVLPYARAALQAVRSAKLAVANLSGLIQGRVRVGIIRFVVAPVDVSTVLADFVTRHPDVELSVIEATTDALQRDVLAGELDMAFLALSGPAPAGLHTQEFVHCPLVAAVGPDNPVAGQVTVSLSELASQPLICMPTGTGTRAALERALKEIGLEPQVKFQANDPQILIELATRGLGVAILPEPIARRHAGDVRILEIKDPYLDARVELAWRQDAQLSPAARALTVHARATVIRSGTTLAGWARPAADTTTGGR
ncbi:MAG TPA: LysR substrate-binding domain-containing protein [Jatrophihabitans sp.]|nr:LysR substrate-binding domain-containing protein [Jatrophihabitans sp.]